MRANPTYTLKMETASGSPLVDFSNDCHRVSIERTLCSAEYQLAVGTATIVLDNEFGHFSPENTSGDYYPNITPGRRVEIYANHTSDTFDFVEPDACIAQWLCTSLSTSVASGEVLPEISGYPNRTIAAAGPLTRNFATNANGVTSIGPFQSSAYLHNGVTDSAFNFGTGAATFMFWTNTGSSASDRCIFSYADYNGTSFVGQRLQCFAVGASNNMRFQLVATSIDNATTTTGITPGQNHFYAIQITGSEVRIYKDGNLEATTARGTPNESLGNTNAKMIIGKNWNGSTLTSGHVFGFRVCQTSFSDSAIKRIYDIEKYMANPSSTCLFKGKTKAISVQPVIGPRTVTLDAVDQVANLLKTQINLPLMTSTNPGSLFVNIMSECNVSSFSVSSFAAETDNVPYADFTDVFAASAINKLVNEGLYWFYNNAKDTCTLANRTQTTQGTIIGSHNEYFGFSYDVNDESIINKLRVSAKGRQQATSPSTLAWVSADTVVVSAGTATDIWLSYVNPNDLVESVAATNVTTPAPTTDYLFYTGIGGTGSNYTATSSVDFTGFSSAAKLTVHNHGVSDMYISRLQVQGTPILPTPTYTKVVEVASSQAYYGLKEDTVTNDILVHPPYIDYFAEVKMEKKKDPYKDTSFSLKNVFPRVIEYDLGDHVKLIERNVGYDNRFAIVGVSHDIKMMNGVEHLVRYQVEKIS